MLRKQKESKARKSILETLLRDMQGSAAERLALFERLRAAGEFVNEPVTGVAEAEKTLRLLAAMEKGSGVRDEVPEVREGDGLLRKGYVVGARHAHLRLPAVQGVCGRRQRRCALEGAARCAQGRGR
jgi:hypothetical protein